MWNKIVNPFKYLPLRQAWCWGIVALILTSVFFWQVGLRLTSITQLNLAGDRLWAATVRQVVAWLLFSVVLYLVGVVASSSKVRFVDVASFNLFARIPMDLGFLMFAIRNLCLYFYSKTTGFPFSLNKSSVKYRANRNMHLPFHTLLPPT